MTKRSKWPVRQSNARPLRQINLGQFMLNAVKRYKPDGTLIETITPEQLEKRSDLIAQGKLKLERKKVKPPTKGDKDGPR